MSRLPTLKNGKTKEQTTTSRRVLNAKAARILRATLRQACECGCAEICDSDGALDRVEHTPVCVEASQFLRELGELLDALVVARQE